MRLIEYFLPLWPPIHWELFLVSDLNLTVASVPVAAEWLRIGAIGCKLSYSSDRVRRASRWPPSSLEQIQPRHLWQPQARAAGQSSWRLARMA
jgi:hypothetical protein